MDAGLYYQRYKDRGYVFSDEVLTRYALSLATKPFVILSGISGTGKTKIAQLFEALPSQGAQATSVTARAANHEDDEHILLTITEGLISSDGRANISIDKLSAVLEPEELAELAELIDKMKHEENDGNICQPYQLILETPEKGEVRLDLYLQRASSPLARVRARSKKGDPDQFNSISYFKDNYEVKDVLRLTKVGRHRLRIVSTNDQESVHEAQHASEVLCPESNKCFISVKSSWTDASELLGYYNPITGKYSVTKLLRFMLAAQDNPTIPFFLILDEMNLAKVEHYFSDFLSCAESRTLDADGKVRQESIVLFSGSEFVSTDDEKYDEIPGSIEIPLNLYVTGTVNIDDTTHMFSPKVLDRANVIEFNEVFIGGDVPDNGLRLTNFPDFGSPKLAHISMFSGLAEVTRSHIKALLDILKKSNLHFGYRTISEISLFIQNARTHIGDSDNVELNALDIQILQKVLPKFHGSHAKLNDALKEMIFHLSQSQGSLGEFNLNQMQSIPIDDSVFKRSLEKLIKMYEVLSTQGFVSFIE